MVTRIIASIVFYLLIVGAAYPDDITLRCDLDPATIGIIVEQSLDLGVTWLVNNTHLAGTCPVNVTVPDGVLVLLRLTAQYPNGDATRMDAGAWFHSGWNLAVPHGGGVQ